MKGENRELELFAENMEFPSNMELRTVGLPSKVRLGQRLVIEFTLIHEETDTPGRLSVKKGFGFEKLPDALDPVESSPKSKSYRIDSSLAGAPGPSKLRFLVKGGEFNATLAVNEEFIEAEPRGVSLSVEEIPYRWSGEGEINLKIRVDPGEDRVKGSLIIEVKDPTGDEVPLAKGSTRKLKVKGEQTMEHPVALADSVEPSRMDLTIKLETDEGIFLESYEEAILPSEESQLKAHVPGRMISGKPSEIIVDGSETLDPDEVGIEIGGENDFAKLEKGSVQSDKERHHFRITIPEEYEGMHPLRVKYKGEVISTTPVLLEQNIPVEIEDIRINPGIISPGEEGTLVISYRVEDDFEGDLSGVARIGGKRGVKLDLDLPPERGMLERSFTVPESIHQGGATCELRINSDQKQLLRMVKPALMEVKKGSHIEIELKTVHDLESAPEGEFSSYLLPGEEVSSRESFHSLDVITLSSGRRLFVLDGELSGSKDGVDRRCVSLYTLKLITDQLLDRKMIRSTERLLSSQLMVLKWGEGGFGDDTFDRDGELKRILKRKFKKTEVDLTPMANHMLNVYAKGKAGKKYKHSGKVEESITNSLEGSFVGEDKNPFEIARKSVESLLEKLKGSEKEIDVELLRKLLQRSNAELYTSFLTLKSPKDRGKLDEDRHRELVNSLLFNLISSSVMRVELLSSWTGKTIFSWDELRVQRTRALKKEISRTMGLMDVLGDILERVKGRMEAYSSNMDLRRRSTAVRSLEMNRDLLLSGKKGGLWEGKIELKNKGKRDVEGNLNLLLPSDGWGVISPSMEASGPDHIKRDVVVPAGEIKEIALEISTPPGIPDSNRGILYFTPGDSGPEVEP